MLQKSSASGQKNGNKNLMSRNVTEFRHLLNECYITENDLNWTMGLRSNFISKGIEHKDSPAPDVFFKKTAISTIRDQLFRKQPNIVIHANQFSHMLAKKIDKLPDKQTLDQLKFYTNLRKNEEYDRKFSSKSHKQFDLIPFKEKHQFPTFIKRQHIRKTGSLAKEEKESAFDGASNQLPYSAKLRAKNYGFFQPLVRAKGRSKVNLPALAWQVGLRNY